jgi:hypothetical protein
VVVCAGVGTAYDLVGGFVSMLVTSAWKIREL